MLKARHGAELDAVVLRMLPFVQRVRVRPDTLTYLGAAAAGAAAVAYGVGATRTGGLLLLLSGGCDLLDGILARSQGRASRAGGLLDSTMDRAAELAVFGGIAVGLAREGDVAGVALACWALSGAVLTSYIRARAEAELECLREGWMERGERLAVLVIASLLGWIEPGLWIVAIGGTATAVQRLVLARRYLREYDARGVDPTAEPAAREPGAGRATRGG